MGSDGLDAWQAFATDIVARRGAGGKRREPVRVFMTGVAGTGKSRTMRAVSKVAQDTHGRGMTPLQRQQICLQAAPTGCAAFQMRQGATTIHRAFSIGINRFFKIKKSDAFLKRRKRMQNVRLFVFDEISMIGRQMMGKVDYRCREHLQEKGVEWTSWAGQDAFLGG